MQNREHYTVCEQISNAFRRLTLGRKRSLTVEFRFEPISESAKLVLARAKGEDLQKISPLGALQLAIERVNEEAKNEAFFKKKVAKKLGSGSEADLLERWEKSPERILVNEIFTVIKMQQKIKCPVTFREAFNLVYQMKSAKERISLNRLAKIILLDP